MKKLILTMLCLTFIAGICVESTFSVEKSSNVGKEAYTRTNLKAKGMAIYFHNMTKIGEKAIPIGTAVVITAESKKYIKFYVVNDGRQYKLNVPASSYSKYFVEDSAPVVNRYKKDAIGDMRVSTGMTKQEVYMSRGCPAWIALGKKSYFYTLDQILDSDNWFYNKDKRKGEMVVHFENGIVSQIKKLT
ncbi:MAG: hypothetical protein ISS33_04640 [Candidatus Omnitrophica bacterium]|nr:hypothetical protein [Candidatus Omnitrophota bacterium]